MLRSSVAMDRLSAIMGSEPGELLDEHALWDEMETVAKMVGTTFSAEDVIDNMFEDIGFEGKYYDFFKYELLEQHFEEHMDEFVGETYSVEGSSTTDKVLMTNEDDPFKTYWFEEKTE